MKSNLTSIIRPGRIVTLIIAMLILGFAISIFSTRQITAAPGPITGNVFNDANANGIKDAGEGAFSNLAIVNLYNSSGSYVKSRTSDSTGNFSLSGLSAGTYYITVYNTARTDLLNTAPGLVNTIGAHVEQTYGGVGAGSGAGSGPICVGAAPTYTQRTNYGASPSEWITGAQNGTAAGGCFGGRSATMTNPALTTLVPPIYIANTDYTNLSTSLNSQKVVSKVVLTANGGVSDVDFGLSANAVTHTNATGQGSIGQFITNANLIAGDNTMRFTPAVATNQTSGSNNWWRINRGATPFDTLSSDGIVIDGRAYSNTDGTTQLNTNSGSLAGATVGTTNYQISNFNKPELEIVGDPRGGGATSLLQVTGSNTTIANLGFNSTNNYPSSDSKFIHQSGGSNMTVNDNLMGVNVATGANNTTRPQFAIQTAYLLSLNGTGNYRHNYVSSNDTRGMILAGGLLGAGNVVPLVLGDWVIEQNDGPSAGVAIGAGSTRIQIRHNNMPIAALDADTLNSSLGIHTLTENTITGGGVRLVAGLQNTITKNVIKDGTGSTPGVGVGNLSTGNYISQNSFSGNGGNAIDLNTDGVSDNNLLTCLTLSPELAGLANLGIARPTLSNARYNGSTLTLDVGYCGVGIFNVEVYKAAPGTGDSDAGEGLTHLGTFTNLSLINGTRTNQTLPVSGLSAGDKVTAIVVDAVLGNTSEFSPNATVATPPSTPTTAPDMTSGTDSGTSNTDNLTNDTTPTFTGSCTDGETVTLYIDGQAVAPTQVCSGGSYSITPTNALSTGSHTITTTFSNAGGESSQSPGLTITIDTTAPAKPATPDLTGASDTGSSNTDNITQQTQPIFTGSCTIGETVTLSIDGNIVGTQLCSDGSYSIKSLTTLSDGQHTATITTTDVAGNTSVASDSLAFTVDTTAPAAPVITSPANNSTTNDTTPTFTGTGETGTTVTVRDGTNTIICEATVTNGSWSCTPTTELPEGTHTYTATQTDLAGNTSAVSNSITLTIDSVAPLAPVITAPTNQTITNDATPTISGTADNNATVLITINGGAPISVTADGSGAWSYTPTNNLADGEYTVTAVQRDNANNTSPNSNTITFTVDTARPTVTVNKKDDQADPTTSATIRYTIVFSEAINSSTFSPADFTLDTAPNSATTAVTNLAQINSTTWEAAVTGMPNNTTVTLSLAAGTVQDVAGNNSQASTSTDNSVRYEVGPPSVIAQITNDTTPLLTGTCIDNHGLELAVTGPAAHTYTTTCTNDTWEFTVPDSLADGTYTIVVTDTTVGDLTNDPANQANALTIDTSRPTVTVNKKNGQADPTATNEARYTITFSESINASSFTANDLTISGTSGSVQLTQLSATQWEAIVTGMTSGDTAVLSLDANKVNDQAGNTNQASTSTDNSVTYDATAPNAPVITAPNDNTTTNDTTPTITGTGENGATVTVTIDGQTIACANQPIVVTNNQWQCVPTTPLTDGEHEISARLTDAVGNVSNDAATITITIDAQAPATLAAPDLTASSDTGRANNDNFTTDTTPTFTGNCTTGDTIRLYSGTTLIAEGTCSGGNYSLTASPALNDSAHAVTATATDGANNTSAASPALTITIDTTAPTAPTITEPNNITTTDTTPLIKGTGENSAGIAVTIDGTAVTCAEGTVIVASGVWECTPTTPLADGTHTIRAVQTDRAGNASSASTATTVTIDTTAPSAPAAPQLAPSSDTGASNTDAITADTTPTLIGNCETGTTIRLYRAGVLVAEGPCNNGTYSLTPATPLSDGIHQFTATATDAAGNESSASNPLSITIDTTPPAQPSAPDLAAESDSGNSNTDNLTNESRPIFNGSCTTGELIKLYVNTNQVAQGICPAGGTYSLTPTTDIADGTYQIQVTATDIAGNTSPLSSALQITIFTGSPAQPPTIDSHEDGDVINDNTPTFGGSGEEGSTPEVEANNTLLTCEEGPQPVGQDGTWECTPTTPLADGPHNIDATLTDPYGNGTPVDDDVDITVDTVAPAPPSQPTLTPASDTGTSNTDNLTANPRPSFTGTCSNGEIIKLYEGTTLLGQATCSGGQYLITPQSNFDDGPHTVHATATDAGNNTSVASSSQTVTIDTSAPAALTAPDMTAATDSGNSSTDNITKTTQPSFTGDCVTGVLVKLLEGTTLRGQTICSGGTYTITSATLGEGPHTLTATSTDTAGNTSALSPGLTITIDTTTPNAPTFTAPADNTVTNNPTPVIRGTGETGARVTLFANATEVTCQEGAIIVASGTWQCTPTAAMSDATYTLTTTQTDIAGNISSSSSRTITIDTVAPAQLSRPDMTAATDSGVSNTDNVTNNTRPSFTGTCVNGTTVMLRVNSIVVAQGSCTNGSYTLAPTNALTDGAKNVNVVAVDAAGNTSIVSIALSFTIDTVAEKPATPDLDVDSDSGYSGTDNITNVSLPTITGTCQANETVRVYFDNVYTTTTTCFPPFLAKPNSNLSAGNHTVKIEVTDIAGNNSPVSDSLTFTVDTTAPNNPVITTPASGTTPTVTTTSYTTSGTAEANVFVSVRENGVTQCSTTSAGNGAWSCTLTNLTNGNHTYRYVATDAAGNQSSDVANRTIRVNHP